LFPPDPFFRQYNAKWTLPENTLFARPVDDFGPLLPDTHLPAKLLRPAPTGLALIEGFLRYDVFIGIKPIVMNLLLPPIRHDGLPRISQ
jgi:hypothetical protein